MTTITLRPLAIALLAVLPLAACASTEDAATSGPAPTTAVALADDALAPVIDHYEAGRHREALRDGRAVARRAGSPLREQAAYVAGLAALALERHDEAEALLDQARSGRDPGTVARAEAARGLVDWNRGRFALAASRLERAAAASALPPADRVLARRRAAAARDRSAGTSADDHAAATGARGTGSGRFAIQVGAFSEHDHARDAARDAIDEARLAGAADVRIHPRDDRRRGRLFVVQFGAFATAREADRVRDRYGWKDWMVTPSESGRPTIVRE